jgi:hypothetical protein
MQAAPNELTVRQQIISKCVNDQLDSALRQVILARSLSFWRNKMALLGNTQKSRVEVVTPDELQKSVPRGGKYYKRIPRQSGQGYNYIYNPDKYNNRMDAHIDGKEAANNYIKSQLLKCISKVGKKGAEASMFRLLVRKFGVKEVGDALHDQIKKGAIIFNKGKFFVKD